MNIKPIRHLREQIIESYDENELRSLCFKLDITYGEIKRDAISDTVLTLIGFCRRHGRMNDLIIRLEVERKHLIWRAEQADSVNSPQLRDIYFVILAMTKLQVKELIEETIFATDDVAPNIRTRFIKHHELLVKGGVRNLQELYGDTPEEWRPHEHSGLSIRQIIQNSLNYHNAGLQQSNKVFSPKFVTEDFCSDMEAENYKIMKKSIEKQGGMIIVDAVSLHHPEIYKKLSNSGLLTNRKIAVLILSPMNEDMQMNNSLVQEMIRSNMRYVFERFAHDADPTCEIRVGDTNSFKRWFINALTQISIEKQKMPEVNMDRLNDIFPTNESRGLSPNPNLRGER